MVAGIIVSWLAALALLPGSSNAPRFTATIKAPDHAPRIDVEWRYRVVTKPAVKAKLTMNILDPLGGVHPVELGGTTKVIDDLPFTGTFRDFMRFPPEAKGFRLTIRATVKGPGGTRVATWWVKPR